MPVDDDKRRLLTHLTHALDRLARQLHRQQDNARRITILAAQSEQIAETAMALNRLKHHEVEAATDSLVADIKAFAAKVAEATEQAGREVLLGRQVAEAIRSHAQQTAEITRNIDSIPDMMTLRVMLRPLVTTLTLLPERLKASREMLAGVDAISHAASDLADQADALASSGARFNQAAVALGRNLRQFAQHAGEVSLTMQRDARLAADVVDSMSRQTAGLVNEPRPSGVAGAIENGLKWLAEHNPPDAPPVAAPRRDKPVSGIPSERSRTWRS